MTRQVKLFRQGIAPGPAAERPRAGARVALLAAGILCLTSAIPLYAQSTSPAPSSKAPGTATTTPAASTDQPISAAPSTESKNAAPAPGGATAENPAAPKLPDLPFLKTKKNEEPLPPPESFKPILGLDILEIKRMIQIALESGLSEAHVNEITIEDVDGRKVKAREYLVQFERWKKAQKAKELKRDTQVYLTPQDVLSELNATQSKDINRLRDELLLVD